MKIPLLNEANKAQHEQWLLASRRWLAIERRWAYEAMLALLENARWWEDRDRYGRIKLPSKGGA
jgi:hypothetical protein